MFLPNPIRWSRLASSLCGLGAVAALSACGDSGPAPTSRDSLDNATFLTQSAESGTVQLSAGEAAIGGTDFSLLTTAEGDLDFDGEPDAAAILLEKSGQNQFLHLHALLGDGKGASDVSARLIGDRLGVRRITVNEGIIQVNLLIRNPGEPATAQPSVAVSQHFALVGRGIIPVVETQVAEVAQAEGQPRSMAELPALYTHEWTLTSFEMADWTADLTSVEERPSLRFVAELADVAGASGKLSGYAGCNRIFGGFRAEDMTSLLISGVAATRRACEDDRMDFERRFIAAITAVDTYEVAGDALQLTFAGGTLRFEAAGRLLPARSTAGRPQEGTEGGAERQS